METSAAFEPLPGGVTVGFVRGVDRFSTSPDCAKRAALDLRFAVVQETYVKGCADMYFDEPLWRALVEFIQRKALGGVVEVTTEGRESQSLDLFLQNWETTAPDDREPPPILTAIPGNGPALCMVTEYWTRVGGPALYHDSYTYSLYSDRDIGAEVMATLAKAPARARWTMTSEVTTVNLAPLHSPIRRLKTWLLGTAPKD